MGLKLGILVASIAANVVFAALLFHRGPPSRLSEAGSAPASQSSPVRLAARPSKRSAAAQDAPTPLPLPAAAAFDWSQLESQDYKEYLAQLRAFGVPDP